ncbi:MAG: thioredoxin family protein [Oceanococcus sp.]
MKILRSGLSAAFLLTAFALLGCTSPSESKIADESVEKPQKQVVKQDGIAWFDGPVSEAFALAKDTNKPVFMYWGAVWCPPCNVIKSTVFTQQEFIQQTREFVAVYLDGDSEDAQRWGEHFSAMGYPTLVVFNSAGEELTRLSSGMDLHRYREVLALTQRNGKAVQQLAKLALNKVEALSLDDWQMLAWYSWPADQGIVVADSDKQQFFQQLAGHCPDAQLAQRFALLAALYRVLQEQALTTREQNELSSLLTELLADEQGWQLNLDELQYDGVRLLIAASAGDKAQFKQLSTRYAEVMEQTWANESLPFKARLNSLYGLADLALAHGAAASEEIQERLAQRVEWLRQQELSPQQRQSMMPGAADMLHRVGLSEQARDIFQQELERSIAPYYYMAYLAGLERDLGNNEAALSWSRQGWQQAQGAATRTQWGLAHVGRLLELKPSAEGEIIQVLQQVFRSLAKNPGAFYQRSRVRLQRTLPKLKNWADSSQRKQAMRQLGDAVGKACAVVDSASTKGQLCDNWMNLVGATA